MKKTDDPISIQDTYQQELQRDLVNILKRFKRVFKKKVNNSGLLQKSKKNDLQMLGSDPKAAEVVDFAHNNLRDKNPDGSLHRKENWANWYVKQYKKDPSIHTPENQEKIKHFMGMKHIPQVANFDFKNDHDTFDKGIQDLKDAEAKGSEKLKSDENRWAPIEPHHKVIQDLGNGFAWWSLGKPFDEKEGKAMNHCGNIEGKNGHGLKDKLLSLRQTDPSKPGVAKPFITAVNNDGFLGEIKGYANSKPSEKFHDAMVALLLHKNIKGVVGSGYAPEANFQGTDLSPEQYQQVISKKPRIFNPDKSDLPPKFSERDDLSPEVTDLSVVAHKDPEAAKILQEKHNKKYNTPEKIRKEFAKIKNEESMNSSKIPMFAKQALNNPSLDPEGLIDVMGSLQPKDYKHHPLIDQTMRYMTPGVKAERGLLDHPSVTQQEFDEAVKAEPNMVIHKYHSNHPMLNDNHIEKLIIDNQGRVNRKAIQKLAEHPNLSPELIQKVQDKEPRTSAIFLSKNKNFNQSHLDDLLRNGHDSEVIATLANRPDLSIPKEKYTQIVSDLIDVGSTGPAIEAQRIKHDIKNHPLTDEKELTKLIDTTPRTGWAEDGIYDHPKMTPELKERVKKDFLANVRNPSHNDTYESEIEKSPVFKEDPEFYKQEFKKAYSAQHNDRPTKWHTPEEYDAFYKQKIAEGSNPAGSTTDWFFRGSHASDDTKRMFANHPDMLEDEEKARFAGKYLNDDEKLRLMLSHFNIQDDNVPSHIIDKYLDAQKPLDQTQYPGRSVNSIKRILNHESIQLNPQQFEKLKSLGHDPLDYIEHMNAEQRNKYSEGLTHSNQYNIKLGKRRDKLELPPSAFKEWYRGVTDDSPREQIDVAREAMYDEQKARKHQLLTRTLGQNAKPEDLEKYKYSHDEDVRIAANQEIERRKGLQKSTKSFGKFKEILNKSRCWTGYKPTPGKKPYSKGSCEPVNKAESLEKVYVSQHNASAASGLGVGRDNQFEDMNYLGSKKIGNHIVHIHNDEDEGQTKFTVHSEPNNKNSPIIGIVSTGDNFEPTKDGDVVGGTRTEHSYVNPEHRGKGIGSALYQAALMHHGKLYSSGALSPHSDKMWRLLKKMKGAKVKIARHSEKEFSPQHFATYKEPIKKSSNNIKLEHYSDQPNLKESGIDPGFHGKGVPGDESKRKANNPSNFVNRSYHYIAGTIPEPNVGSKQYKYTSEVPEDKIYDYYKDPLNLADKARLPSGQLDTTEYENQIKMAGFHGYINRNLSNKTMASSVALFYKINPNNINTKINQKVNKSMDDKLQKMCNYLKKAQENWPSIKSRDLRIKNPVDLTSVQPKELKKGGLISNSNDKMDSPITSAVSAVTGAIGNMFGGGSTENKGSGLAAGANLDRGSLDSNAGAMKNAFRKSKLLLEKAKQITPTDVMNQYNAPKIKTKTTQNVMSYQDKEPKENILRYDEINKIKTKPSEGGINYQELKAPVDNEPNWKKKMKMGKSEEDNDSHMADSDLNSVNHHSQEIKQNLDPNKDLPDWVDSKINTSANEMSDVAHYLESNPQDSKKQMTEVLKKCKMKMAKAWKPFMD